MVQKCINNDIFIKGLRGKYIMSIKNKYNLFILTLLLFSIISIFINVEYSRIYQAVFGILIACSLAVNIKLIYDFFNTDFLAVPQKTNVLIIILFALSCILILPYEIKIRLISFNYGDCVTMTFLYLSAATSMLYLVGSIYKKRFKNLQTKTIIAVFDIILLFNIAMLFVRAILLNFGIYWDDNFNFIKLV